MQGTFPSPRTPYSTQCGLSTDDMTQLTLSQVRRAKSYEFCRKCSQLLGLT